MKDPLVWIDCEMTGLDVERDALIEVAVVVTDGDLTIVDPGMDVLITPPAEALDILESIQELEYYRRVLFPAEPVTTEHAREVAREVIALGIPAMGEEAEA